MLPQALLHASSHVEGERIVPHYFTARDSAWLGSLLDECARFVSRKRTELLERLREPLPTPGPKAKLRIAVHVLEPLLRERTESPVPPKEARAALFREAALSRLPRVATLERVAAAFGVTLPELESSLFADLQGERRVAALPATLSASRLAADANLAIVSSLVRRAASVRISAWGNAHALVRHARRMGLLCTLTRAHPGDLPGAPTLEARSLPSAVPGEGVVLDLSGPFALFQHTEVYGRALASLVPRLTGCERYELEALCSLTPGAAPATLVVRSGDPLGSGRGLARRESRLEARFEREFRRAAPAWEVIREPRPVTSGDRLIFPDFELVYRSDRERRWLLEIVGFWTPNYVRDKLERVRGAGADRLLLCIDEGRYCAEGELPSDARIIRYNTRIDPMAVLERIGG